MNTFLGRDPSDEEDAEFPWLGGSLGRLEIGGVYAVADGVDAIGEVGKPGLQTFGDKITASHDGGQIFQPRPDDGLRQQRQEFVVNVQKQAGVGYRPVK